MLLALAHADGVRCRKRRTRACSAPSTGCWRCKVEDGGWAAFDVDNNWEFLSSVPFADHNAMLDPTCPDITGRVLEALAACGVPNTIIRPSGAASSISSAPRKPTEAGTAAGASTTSTAPSWRCAACRPSGESDREAYILRAGEWLRSIQNADGGWGESCASYDNQTFMPAHSTPSQTAWAMLGLLAGGDTTSNSVQQRHRISDGDAAAGRRLG